MQSVVCSVVQCVLCRIECSVPEALVTKLQRGGSLATLILEVEVKKPMI